MMGLVSGVDCCVAFGVSLAMCREPFSIFSACGFQARFHTQKISNERAILLFSHTVARIFCVVSRKPIQQPNALSSKSALPFFLYCNRARV